MYRWTKKYAGASYSSSEYGPNALPTQFVLYLLPCHIQYITYFILCILSKWLWNVSTVSMTWDQAGFQFEGKGKQRDEMQRFLCIPSSEMVVAGHGNCCIWAVKIDPPKPHLSIKLLNQGPKCKLRTQIPASLCHNSTITTTEQKSIQRPLKYVHKNEKPWPVE